MSSRYGNSKMTLTAISAIAFTGLAGWISIHGPFGASSTAATTAQAQGSTQTPASTQHVAPRSNGSSTSRTRSSASAPVARSRGS